MVLCQLRQYRTTRRVQDGGLASTYTYDGDSLKRSSQEIKSGRTTLVWDGTDYLQGRLTKYANASIFEFHNFPAQLTAGSTSSVTVVPKSAATSTWAAAADDRLGSQTSESKLTLEINRRTVMRLELFQNEG